MSSGGKSRQEGFKEQCGSQNGACSYGQSEFGMAEDSGECFVVESHEGEIKFFRNFFHERFLILGMVRPDKD
jgi:hypothetical protein